MSVGKPVVEFVIRKRATHWADLERLGESDIERQPHRFVGGRNSWIAQTFLRLRAHLEARGWTARVSESFHADTIAIVHRDDANRFASPAHASFLVVVRADRGPVAACDFAIVQNALAPAAHERFVPLWPQPGLCPRHAQRGEILQRLAYHGRVGSIPAWFASREFIGALRRRGIDFEVKASGWEDYQHVDLALAVRECALTQLRTKPATKLYNAWLAGVPMLAAPEPAYRELRRSVLDFLEVESAADVLRAVDLLRANPRLYRAMAANGERRGREFDVQAVRERWLALLDGEISPAFASARKRLPWRHAWYIGAMVEQKVRSRIHRMRVGMERSRLPATTPPRPGPSSAASARPAPRTEARGFAD